MEAVYLNSYLHASILTTAYLSNNFTSALFYFIIFVDSFPRKSASVKNNVSYGNQIKNYLSCTLQNDT